MFWDTADTDMDLHLLSPAAKRWFDNDTKQDCFHSTCHDDTPAWSSPASDAAPGAAGDAGAHLLRGGQGLEGGRRGDHR
jgi:hypothetical protein